MTTLALKILGIIILVLVLLLSLRAVITVSYSDELTLYVRVLFVKIKILPAKKGGKRVRSMSRSKAARIRKKLRRKEKQKLDKKLEKKKKKAEEKETKEKKSLGEIIDTLKMIAGIVGTVLRKFFRHLRVDVARFNINIASDNAATTAIAYGAATQTVSYIMALLADSKNVRGLDTAQISINADYLSDTPTADIKLSFSLRVWHVFDIAFAALFRLIRSKLAQNAKREAKAEKTEKERHTEIAQNEK